MHSVSIANRIFGNVGWTLRMVEMRWLQPEVVQATNAVGDCSQGRAVSTRVKELCRYASLTGSASRWEVFAVSKIIEVCCRRPPESREQSATWIAPQAEACSALGTNEGCQILLLPALRAFSAEALPPLLHVLRCTAGALPAHCSAGAALSE